MFVALWMIFCSVYTIIGLVKSLKKKSRPVNPYIQMETEKMLNDIYYDAYIEWMQKHRPDGLPIDKHRTAEEHRFESEMNDLMSQNP